MANLNLNISSLGGNCFTTLFILIRRFTSIHEEVNPYAKYSSSVAKGEWKTVSGTFTLSSNHKEVVFYLEGPPPEVNLLVRSVTVTRAAPNIPKVKIKLNIV